MTYHVRREWWIWAWFCLGGGIAGVGLLLGSLVALYQTEAVTAPEVVPQCFLFLGSGGVLALLLRYALTLLTMRLIISPQGVEYRNAQGRLKVTWGEVQSLCVIRWYKFWLYDGLWVRPHSQPARAIPAALFDTEWPKGDITILLSEYVPRLFAPLNPPPAQPPRRRRHRPAPVTPPAALGNTRRIPLPQSVYNTEEPDAPADPPDTGVDTIRF
jgi:hypothetical protein